MNEEKIHEEEQELEEKPKHKAFDWKSAVIGTNGVIVFLLGLASFQHYEIFSPDLSVQFIGGIAEGIVFTAIGAAGVFLALFVRD